MGSADCVGGGSNRRRVLPLRAAVWPRACVRASLPAPFTDHYPGLTSHKAPGTDVRNPPACVALSVRSPWHRKARRCPAHRPQRCLFLLPQLSHPAPAARPATAVCSNRACTASALASSQGVRPQESEVDLSSVPGPQ